MVSGVMADNSWSPFNSHSSSTLLIESQYFSILYELKELFQDPGAKMY